MPAIEITTIGIKTLETKRFGTTPRSRSLRVGFMAIVLCGVFGGQAFADCSADIGGFSKKRQAIIDDLNKSAKASPKGQLDPTASCPKLRSLAATEQELLAYMQKNKEWCAIPDEVVKNFTESSAKSRTIAAKACAFAEQIKKGLVSGAAQGPKLPAGPL
jgi:hypothetical protein